MLKEVKMPRVAITKACGNHANSVLDLLLMLPDEALIAGGFPRDIAYGKPFKDIDIIFSGTDKKLMLLKSVLEVAFKVKVELEKYIDKDEDGDYAGHIIRDVYKVKGIGIPIDIIVVDYPFKDNPIKVITNFDLSINQAYLRSSPRGFIEMYYNAGNKVEVIHDDVVPKPERIARLKGKYPEKDWSDFDKVKRKVNVRKDVKVKFEPFGGMDVAWREINGGGRNAF